MCRKAHISGGEREDLCHRSITAYLGGRSQHLEGFESLRDKTRRSSEVNDEEIPIRTTISPVDLDFFHLHSRQPSTKNRRLLLRIKRICQLSHAKSRRIKGDSLAACNLGEWAFLLQNSMSQQEAFLNLLHLFSLMVIIILLALLLNARDILPGPVIKLDIASI